MRSSLKGSLGRLHFPTCIAACLLAIPLSISAAEAAPLAGEVVQSQSRWGYGKTAIVTESVIRRPDGSHLTVQQLGGSTEGIGMRILHSPMMLSLGDQVILETVATRTASGRTVHKLDAVLSLRAQAPAGAEGADKSQETQEFVLTANASGADIHWRSGCAFLSVASEGSTQIAGQREFEVVDEVIAHWTQETRGCSTFDIINEGPDDREVGLDGINLIKFREEFWCRPASGDDAQECYDQAAAGLTTLFFIDDDSSSRNGEIIDADIEFNGVQFAFAADGTSLGTSDCEADLANTLTHELGHFVGLDHTCWIQGPRLVDDEGNQVPSCSGAIGPEITDATMYNFQSCGETSKTSLTADDVAGFCAIYPSATTTTDCKRADIEPAGCCSVAGPSKNSPARSRGILLMLLAALAALSLIRVRARR